MNRGIFFTFEADPGQNLFALPKTGAALLTRDLEGKTDVFQRSSIREKAVVLKDHAHLPPELPDFSWAKGSGRKAADLNLSPAWALGHVEKA
jgi:hypothetical protein